MIFSAAGCALAIGAIVGGIAGLLPGGVPEVPYLFLAALLPGCYGIQILLVFKAPVAVRQNRSGAAMPTPAD